MDVKHVWQLRLSEQQKTHSTQRNNAFLREVRERRCLHDTQSSRLKIAACAAALAWFFAMLQGLFRF